MTAAFPPLQWSTEFKCGDPLIDQQHESLFNIVNRMIGAVNAGMTEKIIECLDELVMHVIEHFRDEESVLVRCDYPDLREHRERHMTLLQKTLTLREMVARDASRLPELMKFVIDEVIVAHLIKADRLYFTSLAKQY